MKFDSVYIVGHGSFLPGEAVDNDHIDDYIRPVTMRSDRIKKMILKENGIQTRHYGIDKEGNTVFSLAEMAAEASRRALESGGLGVEDLSLIATGTTGGDQAIPGFANMLQAEMKAPPLETSSHTGICMSGVVAFKHAALSIENGGTKKALVSATDFPSRMFKKSRMSHPAYDLDFDSHFLRWMLSDGSGSCVLSNEPSPKGISVKVNWIHTKSFSGDYPLCMQIGSPKGNDKKSYLDYPSLAEAEADGAFLLRQNIRLLPNLFDVGIGEFVKLINQGTFKASEVDHFLCHYSSEKFAPLVEDLFAKASIDIPKSKWFSNLKTRGNTGSASIFIMLDEFLRTKNPKVGDRILCFIPESGRISVSLMHLEVVDGPSKSSTRRVELKNKGELGDTDLGYDVKSSLESSMFFAQEIQAAAQDFAPMVDSPSASLKSESAKVSETLRGLNEVWHNYRSKAWRSGMIRKIKEGRFETQDYLQWMENWIPQVRQGSLWMREAIANLSSDFQELKDLITEHANEEQNDWKILFNDYKKSGGLAATADDLKRNRGGEALNSFMFCKAEQKDSIDLLGAIYIIEGTGQKIIPALLSDMKAQTGLPPECFNFLKYHGENDENHLLRWLAAVEYVIAQSKNPNIVKEIIQTAEMTANLYLLQLEGIRFEKPRLEL